MIHRLGWLRGCAEPEPHALISFPEAAGTFRPFPGCRGRGWGEDRMEGNCLFPPSALTKLWELRRLCEVSCCLSRQRSCPRCLDRWTSLSLSGQLNYRRRTFHPEAINFTFDPSPQVEASFQSQLKKSRKYKKPFKMEVLCNRQCLLFELFLLSLDRISIAHYSMKH